MLRLPHLPLLLSPLFTLLAPVASLRGQVDSVITLSPRVGSVIDFNERTYFDIFRDCPESDSLFVVRDTTGSEGFIVRSISGQSLGNIDAEVLAALRQRIDFREPLREGFTKEDLAIVREEEEGSRVTVELKSSVRRTGELLFGDVNGVVLRDSTTTCIPVSEIRSITTPRTFGVGIRTMTQVGLSAGIVLFGFGGLLGGDSEASGGVVATAFFSGLGGVAGLLYDIVAAAAGDVRILAEKQEWDEAVINDVQSRSRFPLGTPEYRELLGATKESSLRQP